MQTFIFYNYHMPQLLKMTGLLHWHLHSCVTVHQTFYNWMLGYILWCVCKLFGVSQGRSLFLMKVITKTQGKYCQI